jgi:hypothetical protein
VRNYSSITVVDCMHLWEQWLQMSDSSLSCQNFGERKKMFFGLVLFWGDANMFLGICSNGVELDL